MEEAENEAYLTRQLITYIGNKRALLGFIGQGLSLVKRRLGRERLDLFDVFSGSGIVSRYFKAHARRLVCNDLERYAQVINSCYLENKSGLDLRALEDEYRFLMARLEGGERRGGFVAELYAPRDDQKIGAGERVFYTRRNAAFIDSARQFIGELPREHQAYFIAPLLAEASVHANTSGVFKGFYKNPASGLGQFGGKNEDALSRIKGDIQLCFPLFSDHECEVDCRGEDANLLADRVGEVDLAYLDPPYNQHPYGSNYFMLNLIADYKRPDSISRVSGIPRDWQRSRYNRAAEAERALADLALRLPAKFLLVSFNSEGFIPLERMVALLSDLGTVTVLETKYNAFRGSRNLSGRAIHVREYLYLVEKR
jgi:adenine-specific DNA-methyltransferase